MVETALSKCAAIIEHYLHEHTISKYLFRQHSVLSKCSHNIEHYLRVYTTVSQLYMLPVSLFCLTVALYYHIKMNLFFQICLYTCNGLDCKTYEQMGRHAVL